MRCYFDFVGIIKKGGTAEAGLLPLSGRGAFCFYKINGGRKYVQPAGELAREGHEKGLKH
jgi:hypothetical protein